MNNQIPVSTLIAALSNCSSDKIRLLTKSLEAAQRKALQKEVLVIEIDSDDDFPVNGKSNFYGEFTIEKDIYETFKAAIDSIDFGEKYPTKNSKLNYFLEGLRGEEVERGIKCGSVSFGGNQTLDAYIQKPANILHIGKLSINLKE